MRYLVTGANGYLGRGITKKLLDDGHEVIATDLNIDLVDGRAQRIKADLFSIKDPFEYFGNPDMLVHLAWRNGFVHNHNSHIDDLNLHMNFIELLLKSGLKNISIMGSVHEVGFYEGSIDENTPCNPQSMYGISKNALRQITELLCKKYNARLQWLRAFYIVSNEEYGNSIFSKITKAANNNEVSFPFTLGQNQFDFLSYNDFCEQVVAVTQQKEYNGIINVCSGYPEKLADRVQRFIDENNLNIKLEYGAFPDRPYDSKAIWGNNTKIKAIMEKYYDKKNSTLY